MELTFLMYLCIRPKLAGNLVKDVSTFFKVHCSFMPKPFSVITVILSLLSTDMVHLYRFYCRLGLIFCDFMKGVILLSFC